VAFVRFGFTLNPKLFFRGMIGLLLLITVLCYMPASRSAAGTFVAWLDARVARLLTGPSHPASKSPRRIAYDLSSIETIVFFDPLTSEARVWYYAAHDGGIELFDGPGYHPQYKVQLQAITPDIVAQIGGRLDADAQEKALEERRRQEAQRASPTPARRIDYDYVAIDKMVFFDPLTAEPRVWYYKAQDGTIDLFDRPGYHPQYGGELRPISPEIVAEIGKQSRAALQDVGRRGASGVRKPPVIAPEDANGRVEGRHEQEPLRWRDTAIEPEQTSGQVVRPKNR
jgi:hypothetical protein